MQINWKADKELMDLVLGWRSEAKSFGEIAAALTVKLGHEVKRNQVAGFLSRNFTGGPIKYVSKKKKKEKETKPPAPKLGIAFPIAPIPEPEFIAGGPGKRLVDLTFFSCRWPIGDPLQDDFRFCGENKQGGSVYCSQHHKLAYHIAPKRTRAEAKAAHVRNLQMLRINDKKRRMA